MQDTQLSNAGRAPTLPDYAQHVDARMRTLAKRHNLEGPTCHVGSLFNSPDASEELVTTHRAAWQQIIPGRYVGIDIAAGLNVDIEADLCAPTFAEDHANLVDQFGMVYASALLEHVVQPFEAAKNLQHLLRPGGHIYYSGPWVWGYHPYPDDYWRFSLSALKVLFPAIKWTQTWYSGSKKDVGISIRNPRKERKVFAQANVSGAAALISERAMPYLNISAVGRKRA